MKKKSLSFWNKVLVSSSLCIPILASSTVMIPQVNTAIHNLTYKISSEDTTSRAYMVKPTKETNYEYFPKSDLEVGGNSYNEGNLNTWKDVQVQYVLRYPNGVSHTPFYNRMQRYILPKDKIQNGINDTALISYDSITKNIANGEYMGGIDPSLLYQKMDAKYTDESGNREWTEVWSDNTFYKQVNGTYELLTWDDVINDPEYKSYYFITYDESGQVSKKEVLKGIFYKKVETTNSNTKPSTKDTTDNGTGGDSSTTTVSYVITEEEAKYKSAWDTTNNGNEEIIKTYGGVLDLSNIQLTNYELDLLKFFDLSAVKKLILDDNQLAFLPNNLFANSWTYANDGNDADRNFGIKITTKFNRTGFINLQELSINNNPNLGALIYESGYDNVKNTSQPYIFRTDINEDGKLSSSLLSRSFNKISMSNCNLTDDVIVNLMGYTGYNFFSLLTYIDISHNNFTNLEHYFNGDNQPPVITTLLYYWTMYGLVADKKTFIANNNQIADIDINDLGSDIQYYSLLGSDGWNEIDLSNNLIQNFNIKLDSSYQTPPKVTIDNLNLSDNSLVSFPNYNGFNSDTNSLTSSIVGTQQKIDFNNQNKEWDLKVNSPSGSQYLQIPMSKLPTILYQQGKTKESQNSSGDENLVDSWNSLLNPHKTEPSQSWEVWYKPLVGGQNVKQINVTNVVKTALENSLKNNSNYLSIKYTDMFQGSGIDFTNLDFGSNGGWINFTKSSSGILYSYNLNYIDITFTEVLWNPKTHNKSYLDLDDSVFDKMPLSVKENLKSKKPSELLNKDLTDENDDGEINNIANNVLSYMLSDDNTTAFTIGGTNTMPKYDGNVVLAVVNGAGIYDDNLGTITLRVKVVGGYDELGYKRTFIIDAVTIGGFKTKPSKIALFDTINVLDNANTLGGSGFSKGSTMNTIEDTFKKASLNTQSSSGQNGLNNFINEYYYWFINIKKSIAFDVASIDYYKTSQGKTTPALIEYLTDGNNVDDESKLKEEATYTASDSFNDQKIRINFSFNALSTDASTIAKELVESSSENVIIDCQLAPNGEDNQTYNVSATFSLSDLNEATTFTLYSANEIGYVKQNFINDNKENLLKRLPSQLTTLQLSSNIHKFIKSPKNLLESGFIVNYSPINSGNANDNTGAIQFTTMTKKAWNPEYYNFGSLTERSDSYLLMYKNSTVIAYKSSIIIQKELNTLLSIWDNSPNVIDGDKINGNTFYYNQESYAIFKKIKEGFLNPDYENKQGLIEEIQTLLNITKNKKTINNIMQIFIDQNSSQRFDVSDILTKLDNKKYSINVFYKESTGTISFSFQYKTFFDINPGISSTTTSFSSNQINFYSSTGNIYNKPNIFNDNIHSTMIWLDEQLFKNQFEVNKDTYQKLKDYIKEHINEVLRIPNVAVNDKITWEQILELNNNFDDAISIIDAKTGLDIDLNNTISKDTMINIKINYVDLNSNWNQSELIASQDINTNGILKENLSDAVVGVVIGLLVVSIITAIILGFLLYQNRKKYKELQKKQQEWFAKIYKQRNVRKTNVEQLILLLEKEKQNGKPVNELLNDVKKLQQILELETSFDVIEKEKKQKSDK